MTLERSYAFSLTTLSRAPLDHCLNKAPVDFALLS